MLPPTNLCPIRGRLVTWLKIRGKKASKEQILELFLLERTCKTYIMKQHGILCIVFLFVWQLTASGIETEKIPLNFDYFSAADGLSQNDVTCIAQDSLGFLWFGTRNGLNKYDGYKFICYKHETHDPSSLSNSVVTAIDVAVDGKVWIGTIDGLNIYDPHTDCFERIYHDGFEKQLFRNKNITFIQTLPDGEQWMGAGNLLCRKVKDKSQFLSYGFAYERNILNRLTRVNCIFEDSRNNLWVGDSYGLHLFDRRKETFQQILPAQERNRGTQRPSFKVYHIQSGLENNVILIATNVGLFTFNTVNESLHELKYKGESIGEIRQTRKDEQNNFWIATQANGLFLLKGNALFQYKYSPLERLPLLSDQLTSLFIDKFNNMWMGTEQKGIMKASLNKSDYTLLAYQPNDTYTLSDNVVRSVLVEDSIIWVGTEYGVLNKIIRPQSKIKRYELTALTKKDLPGLQCITSIKRGRAGRLWITSGSGLFYFDERQESFSLVNIHLDKNNVNYRYQNMINSVTVDDEGNLWCSSPFSTFILQENNMNANPYNVKVPAALISKNAQVVYQDKRGDMWIGTQSSGLVKYTGNLEKHSFEHYSVDGVLFNSNNISALFEDSRNRFWVGTWGGGLNLFDRDSKQVVSYTTSMGLLDNTVFSITEDSKGKLWISTYAGLTSFDADSAIFEHHHFRNNKEGFEINYGAHAMGKDNTLFLGTNEGLIMYNPAKAQNESQHNRIVFTSLIVNGEETRIGDATDRNEPIISESISTTPDMTISYKDKHFSIGFTDFNNLHNYPGRFAYKLNGFDKEWIVISENKISYTNLSPGEYTLMVQNVDRHGKLMGNIARLNVHIQPPFWNTVYAYILYGILLLAAIYASYRSIIRRTGRKRQQMQEEAERDLYQAKMKFFTNISHEIRSPLTLILGPIARIKEALKDDEKLSKQIEIMDNNGDRLLRMVNQLLNLRKIEMGGMQVCLKPVEFVSFVKKVCAYFDDACARNTISMNVHSVPNRLECSIDEDKVEKIVYNILSNAVKYTKSYIEVFVDVDDSGSEQEKIIIKIRDNGRGIDKTDIDKIFHRFFQTQDSGHDNQGTGIGLHLAKEFATVIGGGITVESEKNKGTEFTISIPCHRMAVQEIKNEKTDDEETAENKIEMATERPVVLIVEDNEDIRTYLRTSLDDTYEIREAKNGLEGEEMAIELLPDMIISDIMMPIKNGIEMNIDLKNNILTKHIPIIMLTAKTADETKKESLEAGADAYITKPFSEGVLRAQISRILSSKEEYRNHLLSELLMTPQKFKEAAPENEFLSKVVAIVEQNLTEPEFDVAQLSRELGMSRVHLYRTFKSFVGHSPSDFIKDFRLQRGVDILLQKKYNVNEIAYMTGFNDPKYFTSNFKKKYGMTPTEYLKKYGA